LAHTSLKKNSFGSYLFSLDSRRCSRRSCRFEKKVDLPLHTPSKSVIGSHKIGEYEKQTKQKKIPIFFG